VAAAADDVWQRSASRPPDAEEINFDNSLKFTGINGGDGGRRIGGDSSVGENDVEAAESVHGLFDRLGKGAAVGDIDCQRQSAGAPDLVGDLVDGILCEIGEHNVGAARVQCCGAGCSDAASGAGDQNGFIRKGQGQCHGWRLLSVVSYGDV
jgi:hypothetical protein